MSDNQIINKLNAELANKIATIRNMTPNHPEYNILRSQIAELKTRIEAINAWSKVS